MKNCKIKRVLAPYAKVEDFVVGELMSVMPSGTHVDYVGLFRFVYISGDGSLKLSTNMPVRGQHYPIKYTPKKFLKHYLKK